MKLRILISATIVSFFMATGFVKAQSTVSPDTVCAGATGEQYSVTATAGSTYYWVIPNGTKASGGTTSSITVDWSSTSGTDTMKVVETNAHGCVGDTVKLAVYRMPRPTATISHNDSVCWNHSSYFDIAFTGVGPWNVTYSDGTTSTNLTNISTSPYRVNTPNLTSSKTYTITALSCKFGCSGTYGGSAVITVNPKPVTSAISHH